MASFEFLAIIVSILGLAVSLVYYATVLSNQNKTRRLQMIQHIWEWISSEEGYRQLAELLKMQWNDIDDFNLKYGVETNPENYAMRWAVWNKMNGLGYMVREGAIDAETIYDHSGGRIIWLWVKFSPIILEFRSRASYAMKWWEYLVDQLIAISKRRGDDFSFIPDEYLGDAK
jgi:hypothetical protein